MGGQREQGKDGGTWLVTLQPFPRGPTSGKVIPVAPWQPENLRQSFSETSSWTTDEVGFHFS